jgi:6-phosphogluconolactonase
VALSGGRIASRFFEAVVDRAGDTSASLAECHYFWADERCVPPSSPESNYAIAKRTLLEPLGIPQSHIHRVHGELDPVESADRAIEDMRCVVPQSASGQPVIDLVFLGMGEDGHVASLFPGETEDTVSESAWYRSVMAQKPPPHRVTLGYAALAAAREVWVLASGSGKKAALDESLTEAGQTPLAKVLKSRQFTRILSDI